LEPVAVHVRHIGAFGRSYATVQAAKTALFAAGNEGAVSKKSLAIFSNEP
jgi:hypothetical protein